jgi:hypothetical protein
MIKTFMSLIYSGALILIMTNISYAKVKKPWSFSYYHQLTGPTLNSPSDETYNVFLESNAPVNSFHAINFRYSLPKDFSLGFSFAATHQFGGRTKLDDGIIVKNELIYFNPRIYATLPPFRIPFAKVFSTVAYEMATSNISRDNETHYGIVAAQSINFESPHPDWNYGLIWQLVNYKNRHNNLAPPANCSSCTKTPLQTNIFNFGPFINYKIDKFWQIASVTTFDWDQRGHQNGLHTGQNLPDRSRLSLNYYPDPTKIKFLTQFGLFTQFLTKMDTNTTVFGFDFGIKF